MRRLGPLSQIGIKVYKIGIKVEQTSMHSFGEEITHNHKGFLLGKNLAAKDPILDEIGRSGSTSRKSYRNISRNFHRQLYRHDRVLPVKVSMVPLWVLQHRPKVKEIKLRYPMIALKDWAMYLLNQCAHLVLGGFKLTQSAEFTDMYNRFWIRYQKLDPLHPFFEHHPRSAWGRCIPFPVHGDEGRGKAKNPILITSFQMMIGPQGEDTTNISGYLIYIYENTV